MLEFITGLQISTAAKYYTGKPEDHDHSTLAFVLNAETFVENLPGTIDGLRQRDDWKHWKLAIASELESLRKNETREPVPKPPGKNIVDCKWVFKVKRDETGNTDRYKAHQVVKGYSQRKGYDYDETYAPVAKGTTVRVLLAVANQMGYYMHQMDVKTAFLNGLLKEEIFMRQPEGFERGGFRHSIPIWIAVSTGGAMGRMSSTSFCTKISQPKYVMDLLERFGMADCKPATTPLQPNIKLKREENQTVTTEPKADWLLIVSGSGIKTGY